MQLLLRISLFLLVPYLLLCLAMYLLQDRLVFFPSGPPHVTPTSFGVSFQDLEITAAGGVRLQAWYMPTEDPLGEVLVCHGNAGSIADRIDLAQAFHQLGWSVLLFDYRGYGNSTGSPDEEGTYADAEAAFDALAELNGSPDSIVVYGESLGAAVAIELARRRTLAAVIVESAFTSLPDVGAEAYPFLPVRMLARYRYDSRSKVRSLDAPLLLIHSPADETVPVAHAHSLLEAAGESCKLLLTAGGHNDRGWRSRPEWRTKVEDFLESSTRR
jgi:fermentation-respiration switch protein FrsA (DUF1100 family)